MNDAFYNELSIDSSFVNLPTTKQAAKELLFQFVNSCISYILAKGIDQNTVMQVHEKVGLFTSLKISNTNAVSELLLELYNEDRISEIEKMKFQLFVNESFSKSWDGEYLYNTRKVFGIGKAKEEASYVISFGTSFLTGNFDWTHSQYRIQKVWPNGSRTFDFERNIASPKHVLNKFDIWKTCRFKLKKPTQKLLPNLIMSSVVPIAFDCSNWSDFYQKYATNRINRNQCMKVAKVLARVNGWEDIGKRQDNRNTSRDTYNSKNYYLQVDTQHAAFEVYKIGEAHIGEIKFNQSNLFYDKKKDKAKGKKRFIRL